VADQQNVPLRAENLKAKFVHMSDDSLWHYAALAGGEVVVGLKAPAANRGVFHGQILMGAEEWRQAIQALHAFPGLLVLEENQILPNVKVKIPDLQTLAQIRKLSTVDYVEPAKLRNTFSYNTGCTYPLYDRECAQLSVD
jgi:hypothetical protein